MEKQLNRSQIDENKRNFLNKYNINGSKKNYSYSYSKTYSSVEKGSRSINAENTVGGGLGSIGGKAITTVSRDINTEISQNKTKNSLENSFAEVDTEFNAANANISCNNITNITNANILEDLESSPKINEDRVFDQQQDVDGNNQ